MLRLELDTVDNTLQLNGFRKVNGIIHAVIETREDSFMVSYNGIRDLREWFDWVEEKLLDEFYTEGREGECLQTVTL